MGRTTPSVRMALDPEIKRLIRIMKSVHDPEAKKAIEEIIDSYTVLAPVFRSIPPYDKAYAILLAGLLRALEKVNEIERKLEPES